MFVDSFLNHDYNEPDERDEKKHFKFILFMVQKLNEQLIIK